MLQNTLQNLYFQFKWLLLSENKNIVHNLDFGDKNPRSRDLPQDRITSQLKPLLKILHYLGGYPIVEKSGRNLIFTERRDTNVKKNGSDNTANKNDDIVDRSTGKLFYLSDNSVFEKLENINVNKLELLEGNEDIGKYELTYTKWTSAKTWYSYIVKLITFLSVFVFLFNVTLDIPFPLRLFSFLNPPSAFTASDVTQNINTASMSITTILKMVEMIILLANSGGLVDWINKWSIFEIDFWKCFDCRKSNAYFKFDISNFRNLVFLCYLIIPAIVWGIFFSLSLIKICDLPYGILSGVVLLWGLFGVWGSPFVEDTKIALLFKTSVLALRQIRLAIKDRCSSPNYPLTPNDVISWRNLITTTRAQTALACNYIKSQQLIFIAETIIACSLSLGFIVTVIGESELSLKVVGPLFLGTGNYCINSIIRLYIKVSLAEQIPAEELLLAGDITEIDGKCNEAATKTELKFLHNMLTQRTVQVNMGNYFTMNKQLMLQIGAQVVTYLIVIMQFNGAGGQVQQ